jgi:hypothetical protein
VLTGKLRSRRTVFCVLALTTSVIVAPAATWSAGALDLKAQTITFAPIADRTMRDAALVVSATASSGLPVSFNTTGVCDQSGVNHQIISPTGPGTCTVTASQAGDGSTWAPATPVLQTFDVVKAPQTITFLPLPDVSLSVGAVFVSATTSTGFPPTFTAGPSSVCVMGDADGEVDLVAAGTCTVNADQAGGPLDAPAPTVSQSFGVGKAAQAITFATIPDHSILDGQFTVTASSTSLLPVTFTTTTPLVCTATGAGGATIGLVAAGTCSVRADQAGNNSFSAASPITRSFTVTRAPQTITFGALADQTMAQSPVTVAAGASSGLPVTFKTATTIVCTAGGAGGATITLVGPGTCTVEADQAGNTGFEPADAVFQSFDVTKVDQTITFGPIADKTTAQSPVPVSATASSGLPVTFATTTPGVCTAAGTSITLLGAGPCTVEADQTGSPVYSAAIPVRQTFAVTKVDQTINFAALPDVAVGTSITATATASSGLAVTFSTPATPTACTATGTHGATITRLTAGPCTVQADQAGDATYNAAAPVTQTLGVAKTHQTITFASLPNIPVGHAPITVAATASSGLAVTFTTTTPSVCVAGATNGSTITIVGGGTCTVRATQAGNDLFDAATPVARSFTVVRTSQTITFPTPPHTTVAHSPVTVAATASSHLTVTFTTTTPSVCKAGGANGTKITLLGGGTCSLRATQAGDARFAAAPPVVRQFVVDGPVVSTAQSGYWMLGADGHVYAFGSAADFGSASDPAVALAARRDGAGYWIVDRLGNVHGFGSAAYHGGHPALLAGESVSTISATPSGNGYWIFTTLGRAFAFGDAHFFGDMRAVHLNGPIVASVATPTGRGYYMVGSDGGVFSFGDAHFHGSMGAAHLNQPIVGLSPTPDNGGYWLVASDGGVFAFDAPFRGSLGSVALNRPVNGLVAFGNGYLMVASDGGVFNFSNKRFVGSLGGKPIPAPIVGIATNGSA